MNEHYRFIEMTIRLAEEKMLEGNGGPFGALVVKNGKIIGTGFNRVTSTNDPTAHAEIVAIRDACQRENTYQLNGCVLYSSCEPCPMCFGAIYWARPDAYYFAATREDAAHAGFDDSFIYDEIIKPVEKRIIPVTVISHPDKNIPFEKWKELADKIPY